MPTNSDKHQAANDGPIELADGMLEPSENRTISPRAAAMEGAAGSPSTVHASDGQLGPDEISEPDEVIKNNEAKQLESGPRLQGPGV